MHIPDSAVAAIAEYYDELVTSLPAELRTAVRQLPLRLGLTSRVGVDWTEVWDDPVELALPTLVLGELGRPVRPELLAVAQRAHLFALLGMLIRERIEAGLVESDPALEGVLFSLDRQRQRALAELRLLADARGSVVTPDFCSAEREARRASAVERAVLDGRREVDTADYVAICSGKHSLVFVATMVAVAAAGADVDELVDVHDLILAIMLGVGCRKELLGRPQRSWFAALSRTRDAKAVDADMLDLALDAFERATKSAESLGATTLERWADAEARTLRSLGAASRSALRHRAA